MGLLRRLICNEEGQGLVEYALLLAIIALGTIFALEALGVEIINVFDGIREGLEGLGG
jgi:pilus assembly protein Flp/PilA